MPSILTAKTISPYKAASGSAKTLKLIVCRQTIAVLPDIAILISLTFGYLNAKGLRSYPLSLVPILIRWTGIKIRTLRLYFFSILIPNKNLPEIILKVFKFFPCIGNKGRVVILYLFLFADSL